MALRITPEQVTVSGNESVPFAVVENGQPVKVDEWVLQGRGKLDQGVYTAERFPLIGKRYTVTARRGGEQVSATVWTSPAHAWIAILWAYLVSAAVVCAMSIRALWPAPSVTPEETPGWVLILMAALCGALGATLHGMNSLAAYVGAKKFLSSWAVYYLARPFVGALLADLVFLVFRSKLVGDAQRLANADWLSMAALAGLSGLFADKAVRKLEQVVEAVFGAPPDDRPNKLDSPKEGSGGAGARV